MPSDLVQNGSVCDIEKELQAFDESKAGVKGLVDAGIIKTPTFFVVLESEVSCQPSPAHFHIPVIDLKGIHEDDVRRREIVEQMCNASETWGFFQVVNHGISKNVMEGMVRGVKGFHEEKNEVKMEYYTRDTKKKALQILKNIQKSADLPVQCPDCQPAVESASCFSECRCNREIEIKYSAYIKRLGGTLLELLSEALGLERNHLTEIGCAKGLPIMILTSCLPFCKTILAASMYFHQDHWVDVPPIAGAFVVIIGDLLQANHIGPRISVASFFALYDWICAPLKELISDENPLYKEVPLKDYIVQYRWKERDGDISTLDRFRL
ncbi:hypothetical protein H0E87_023331 [Populus deltoides]|uniref:Non-haem dioxygenase N-terminal domain-containing protein n=1 Tax=Populus deltoides TaxID=3696 RepID=A0A8T2XC81_POPDE|nr:hypothetical protein H0E87_023331 [Populus deltoides]